MVLDRKRRISRHYETSDIRKGPWKSEEDEVLINHVNKYGPRDWSSIRSKGLLQRTGKSCRLRWVNKLRPNLKTGVKFTAEEERTVIDLQAQFGNKWAKIATYLSGRTDNDVKNFWSSRKKRLARILHTSAPSSSKPEKMIHELKAPTFHGTRSEQAPDLRLQLDEQSIKNSQTCTPPPYVEFQTIKKELVAEAVYPSMVTYEHSCFQFNCISPDKKPFLEPQSHIPLPSFQQLQYLDFPLPLESQEVMPKLGDAQFLDTFGYSGEPALGNEQLPDVPSFVETDTSYQIAGGGENHQFLGAPDTFMDDFPPIDMFDQIEPLPSPLEWSLSWDSSFGNSGPAG